MSAFMVPTRNLGDEQRAMPLDVAVVVDISGPRRGRMALAVSRGILAELAANMLGDDVPLPLDQQRDALGEMLNIICGAFLPNLEDDDGTYSISSPRPATFEEESAEGAIVVHFGVEDGRAALSLRLE
ncbi:MAG TPA: chemotaxis protein CheX [Acidobacteriota bacterium]|nr:chemotaxis protein CheX [Acidobacteriota bacterium]